MKNSITIMILSLMISGAFITSCSLSNKKAENAQDKIESGLDKAVEFNQERNDSIEQYKIEAQVKVDGFKKSIAELKEKLATEKRKDKAIYQKKLDVLETKNNEMKETLNNLKDEGQEKWVAFRSEFNHDLDEMGKAFKDLTVNNVN